MELNAQLANLKDTFHNLFVEENNLEEKEKYINQINEEIRILEESINNIKKSIKNLNITELEYKFNNLNKEEYIKLSYLSNQDKSEFIKTLKNCENCKCTHCQSCETNCHKPCDCFFFGRCKVFTFWTNKCIECGCDKSRHTQDNYFYTFQKITESQNNEIKIKEIMKEYKEKKEEIRAQLIQKNNSKKYFVEHESELEHKQWVLKEKKRINVEEKFNIEKKISAINNQILYIMLEMRIIFKKKNDIENHIINEDEFINFLMDSMIKINVKENVITDKIKQMTIFEKVLIDDPDEILKLDDSQLAEKLK